MQPLLRIESRTDKPGYGDQLAPGAITLTEAWDANPNSSQNHFMLGHAEEWFYRGLAGINFNLSRSKDERIVIHPTIVGDIRVRKRRFTPAWGISRVTGRCYASIIPCSTISAP